MAQQDCLILPKLGAGTLIIAFTSYGTHAEPAIEFEWIRTVSRLDVSCIFFRDSFQHWYHSACLGYSASLEHTLVNLRTFIRAQGISKVITLGSSMGGHGALLFGALLGADHTIAFAPQVNMDAGWLAQNGDDRWQWKAKEINRIGYDHLNLARLFIHHKPRETVILCDPAVVLDVRHAASIAHFEGVTLSERHIGGHELAYVVTKSGELTHMLESRLAASAGADFTRGSSQT
jgi:pimeloyl-ACP methyl ester carboxylesterase